MRKPTGPLYATENGSVKDVFQNVVATFNDPAVSDWFINIYKTHEEQEDLINDLESKVDDLNRRVKDLE